MIYFPGCPYCCPLLLLHVHLNFLFLFFNQLDGVRVFSVRFLHLPLLSPLIRSYSWSPAPVLLYCFLSTFFSFPCNQLVYICVFNVAFFIYLFCHPSSLHIPSTCSYPKLSFPSILIFFPQRERGGVFSLVCLAV